MILFFYSLNLEQVGVGYKKNWLEYNAPMYWTCKNDDKWLKVDTYHHCDGLVLDPNFTHCKMLVE